MTETYIVAIDLAKRQFQVCVAARDGKTVFNGGECLSTADA